MKKHYLSQIKKAAILPVLFGLILILCFGTSGISTAHAQEIPTPDTGNYSTIAIQTLPDGQVVQELIIHGPPVPPAGYELQRQAVTLSDVHSAGASSLIVPAYSWVYGCSAVSGAMIAAYYDRNGYSNIYTGPTNGGVMPLVEDSSWGTWSDTKSDVYPNNPLIASHAGVDGRPVDSNGSIDDYWDYYGSNAQDPYVVLGSQHSWGDAIGDYMWTSQYQNGNSDGNTTFYSYDSGNQLSCDDLDALNYKDGTLGRKIFYEAKGYTVSTCYNQHTSNIVSGGFTFSQYKAEIDAGRPVMINLYTNPYGHTVVGVGYKEPTFLDPTNVIINDTWNNVQHKMIWGGSYSGMEMNAVSIVNLAGSLSPAPGSFGKTSPANTTNSQVPALQTLTWGTSTDSDHYEYCITTNKKGCTASGTWTSIAGTSVSLSAGTLLSNKTYYWQVRAVNDIGNTLADNGTLWSFKTLPLPSKPVLTAPANNFQTNDQTPDFSWNTTANAVSYSMAIALDKNYNSVVDIYSGTSAAYTSAATLPEGIYYWHVKAINSNGESGQWSVTRSFTVDITAPLPPVLGKPADLGISNKTPSFTWMKPAASKTYQFQLATDASFTAESISTTSGILKSASYKPAAMVCGLYYWRVKAYDGAENDSGWSAPRTVQICLP